MTICKGKFKFDFDNFGNIHIYLGSVYYDFISLDTTSKKEVMDFINTYRG